MTSFDVNAIEPRRFRQTYIPVILQLAEVLPIGNATNLFGVCREPIRIASLRSETSLERGKDKPSLSFNCVNSSIDVGHLISVAALLGI